MKKEGFVGVIIIALIMLSCTLVLINQPVNNLDELWNYNFSRCIYKEMLPYKEFSMITMPLSPLFVGVVMHILGDNLIVYRICGIILYMLIAIIVYRIFKRFLKGRCTIAACFTVMIMQLILSEYRYDYNYFNLLLILLIILISTSCNYTYRREAIIGLLSGLTLCVKQTTGVCIIGANIIVAYILNRKYQYDIKKLIIRYVMSVIPGVMMALYFVITGTVIDFIQYCIYGVTTFNNSISYIQFILSSPFNMIIGIGFPFIIIYLFYCSIKKEDLNILCYLIYACAGCIVMYPITDNYHFYIGAVPVLIIFIGVQDFKKSTNIQNIICAMFSIGIILISTWMIYPKGDFIKSKLPVYKGLNILRSLEYSILNVDNYIMLCETKGENVYIVDSGAAAYTIPLNRYTKDMDMLLIGNTGGKGIMEFDINYDNSKFMLNPNIEQLNWQFDKKWYEIIVTNYKKTGEECGFDIFEREN